MKVGYTFTKNGLQVTFRDISREVPVGSTYHWDFGDSNVADGNLNPVHLYVLPGFYLVILTIDKGGPTELSYKAVVGLTETASTTLSDSIYNLIDYILPSEFISPEGYEYNKRLYIEKWQLYLQPLVIHEVPEEQYNNELYYEALENQLIMELAMYDWVNTSVLSLLGSLSKTSNSGSNDGDVKHIVTGPSEVEFFGNTEIAYKTLVSAIKKDGIIDVIRKNLCMLSQRLMIYLPICNMVNSGPYVPEVANKREPGLLGGPNPTYPIAKGLNHGY